MGDTIWTMDISDLDWSRYAPAIEHEMPERKTILVLLNEINAKLDRLLEAQNG